MRIRVFVALLSGLPAAAPAHHLQLQAVLPASFTFLEANAEELSGLSWISDDPTGRGFFAVEDKNSSLTKLDLEIDPATGALLSAALVSKLQLNDDLGAALPTTYDQEGVAYDPHSNSVLVSNESEPGVRRHSLGSGDELDWITPNLGAPSEFDVYANVGGNLGFEALSRRPDGTEIWTVNEDTLNGDADPRIRLQRLDAHLEPQGQWAYEVDAAPAIYVLEVANGVPDILALHDGSLLVMERAFGATATGILVRVRIYEVDFAGATLLGGGPIAGATPVGKQLLLEQNFVQIHENYEGIAVGPVLDNGDRSVVLIADNASGTTGVDLHPLFALRLLPEPSAPLLLGAGGCFSAALAGLSRRATRAGPTRRARGRLRTGSSV